MLVSDILNQPLGSKQVLNNSFEIVEPRPEFFFFLIRLILLYFVPLPPKIYKRKKKWNIRYEDKLKDRYEKVRSILYMVMEED